MTEDLARALVAALFACALRSWLSAAARPAGGQLPDELVHGGLSRLAGREGWRRAQAEYLADSRAWVYPPPLRWLAWVVVRWRWWPVPTPLGWVLRGRALADAPVGLVWAGAVLSGQPWACGVAALVTLGLKEGSLTLVPSLVVAAGAGRSVAGWFEASLAVAAGVAAWAVVTTAVCGRRWPAVLLKSVLEQGHEYTRGYQSGGVVRVWADAMLVGGWWWLALGWELGAGMVSSGHYPALAASVVALVVQGLGPVQNARVSVGPDLVVRWVVASALVSGQGWCGLVVLALGIGVDVWTSRRLRAVRDPVTAELGGALGRR